MDEARRKVILITDGDEYAKDIRIHCKEVGDDVFPNHMETQQPYQEKKWWSTF